MTTKRIKTREQEEILTAILRCINVLMELGHLEGERLAEQFEILKDEVDNLEEEINSSVFGCYK